MVVANIWMNLYQAQLIISVGIVSLISVALMLINNIDRTLKSMVRNSQSRSPLSFFLRFIG